MPKINNKQPQQPDSRAKTETPDQATAIATTERDISERTHIKQMRMESDRLQGIIEHLPAGAVYVDNDKLTLNHTAETITGYKRDELKTLEQWFVKLYGKRADKIRALYERVR